jgi:hypothetical protein
MGTGRWGRNVNTLCPDYVEMPQMPKTGKKGDIGGIPSSLIPSALISES